MGPRVEGDPDRGGTVNTLYLCGAGNPDGVRLAQRINRVQRRWDDVVVLDDDPSKHGRTILGAPVEGGLSRLSELRSELFEVGNLVARTTRKRSDVRSMLLGHEVRFARLTDPSVDVDGADLADDTIVYHNATIGAEAVVQAGAVVFMGAVVGHECRVGSCCVIGANAVLNARVRLEEGVYIGTNATVLPEVTIGAWSTIAAGSVVLHDVPAGATVIGVPGEIVVPHAPDLECECPPRSDAVVPTLVPRSESAAELEQAISTAWRDVLAVPDIRTDKNFFDAGGTSLKALKVYELLRRDPRFQLRLTDLFHFPTIASLVQHLVGNRTSVEGSSVARRISLRTRRAAS